MSVLSDILMFILNMVFRFVLFATRFILKTFIYGEKGQRVPPIKNSILLESATSIAAKIRTGQVTSVEVMRAFIERVKEINPIINCTVDERYSEALKEAEEVDKFIASGVAKPEELAKTKPFLGVPFTTKDSISVKGLVNTAGWYYRRNVKAEEDAPVIVKMKKAGAIPFCLTNVPELCMWYESNNVNYGRSKNPYDTYRTVGGSSGGEGAILTACGSPFGIGSDIGGSIRIPALFNGIFGHKPSRHIISNELQYPPVKTQEEEHMLGVGPMCKYASDLLPMFKILVKDEKLKSLRLDEPIDVKKLKIYYQENDLGGDFVQPVDEDIQKAFKKVVNYFKNSLKVEVQKVKISRTKNTVAMWLANLKAPGSTPFAKILSDPQGKKLNQYTELAKMIFGQSNHTLIAILTSLKEESDFATGSPEHTHLLEERDKLIEEFTNMLEDDMSVFLYPTHPCVAPYHNETLVKAHNFTYTALVNTLGMPSCNIPLGLGSEGLPVGIQAVANYNNDRLCLAVANELEKAFGGWVSP